jgi:nucleoside-diphosphate-sugar epimerase
VADVGHDLSRADLIVTGAGGYLGRHVLNELARRSIGFRPLLRADADLTDTAATRRVIPDGAVIMHLAAVVPRAAAEYDDPAVAEANLAMVRTILACRPAGVILASSMTVYADAPMPVREAGAPSPGCGYGGAKRTAELLASESGVPYLSLRIPGLFGGDRQSGLLWNVAQAFLSGDSPKFDTVFPRWAALHVDDAAWLFVQAVERLSSAYGPVNAGYPGVFSIPRAIALLAELTERTSPSVSPAEDFAFDTSRQEAILGIHGDFRTRLSQLVETVRSR